MSKVFRDGTSPVWAAFSGIYVLAAIGLSLYWLFTKSGPVGWLARWQSRTLFDGSWYPTMTGLVVFLGAILPLLLIKIAIERVTGKRLAPPVEKR